MQLTGAPWVTGWIGRLLTSDVTNHSTMETKKLLCDRGKPFISAGVNGGLLLITAWCARIHNNTGQLFKCACIEKSTERSSAPEQEKRGFMRGTEKFCAWKRGRTQPLGMFTSVGIWDCGGSGEKLEAAGTAAGGG